MTITHTYKSDLVPHKEFSSIYQAELAEFLTAEGYNPYSGASLETLVAWVEEFNSNRLALSRRSIKVNPEDDKPPVETASDPLLKDKLG